MLALALTPSMSVSVLVAVSMLINAAFKLELVKVVNSLELDVMMGYWHHRADERHGKPPPR